MSQFCKKEAAEKEITVTQNLRKNQKIKKGQMPNHYSWKNSSIQKELMNNVIKKLVCPFDELAAENERNNKTTKISSV